MLPGNSQILTCPFCGKEKEILTLESGNLINAKYWSDNKIIAPMLPEISYIQKCDGCGKYFIRTRQEPRFSEDNYSEERGLLTFQETKEAFEQISREGFENEIEEKEIHMMVHHAYNDHYHRSEEHHEIDPGDWEMFVNNAKWLINNSIRDNLLKAEFYREIGDFDNAIASLDAGEPYNKPFLKYIAHNVRKKAENKDNCVFLIKFDL